MNCPGSVALIAASPALNSDTEFSREGTLAHEEAAQLLSGIALNTGDVWSVDDTAAIMSYVEYCRDLPGSHHVETRLSLDQYIPGGFGTVDFAAFHEHALTIVDLKFGKGVEVYAENNPQLMIYALGALIEFGFLYDIHEIRMVIHQPRRNHVDEYVMTVDELRAWADSKLKVAVLDAMNPKARLVPGDKQCQWCDVKATCPALAQKVIETVTTGFDAEYSLGELLGWVDTARAWCSALEARAMEDLLANIPVEGWKLVNGRSTRSWGDEDAAAEVLYPKLGEQAFNKKLVSPAQAEKIIGKKNADWETIQSTLIKWSEPKPSLARESSSKQAIATNITEGFDS